MRLSSLLPGIIFLLTAWQSCFAQKPDWLVVSEKGSLNPKRMITAPDGGVYMLIQYWGTVKIGSTEFTSAPNTLDDAFLAKFNASGELLWYKQLFESEGYYSNRVIDMKLDRDNNLVFSGSSLWPTKVLTSTVKGVGQFIAKVDATGNLLWVNYAPLPGGSIAEHDISRRGNRIGFDSEGTIFWFLDQINEFAETGGLTVFKYKPDGTKLATQYVTFTNTFYRPNMQDFSVDADGSYTVSGNFSSRVAIAGGPSLYNNGSNFNPVQFFMARFSSTGQFRWAVYSNYGSNLISAHTSDDDGNIYTALQLDAGSVIYTATGGTTVTHDQRSIVKFSKDGELLWFRPMTLSNIEDIFFAPDGLLYVSGTAFGSEFRYQSYFKTIPRQSAYVMKVNTHGDFRGIYFGDPQDNPATPIGSDAYSYQSVVDGSGNIYTAGYFWEGLIWGCIPATAQEYGMFLVKHAMVDSPIRTISGPGTICEGTPITLSTDLISNGVLYKWYTPDGSDPGPGEILNNSIDLTARAEHDGEAVIVSITDDCDTYFAEPYILHVPRQPQQPELLQATGVVCPDTAADFMIFTDDESSYEWTLPDGITSPDLTEEGGTLRFGSSFSEGDIKIKATNFCGSSETIFHISTHPTPVAPTLTGDLVVCPGITQIQHAISPVPNATAYLWELPPFISFDPLHPNNGTSLRAIVVDGLVNGQITVRAIGVCKMSDASAPILVSRKSDPAPAGPISGATEVCTATNSQRYAIEPIANATRYVWSIPGNFQQNGTLTTTLPYIDVKGVTSGEGEIVVSGKNECQRNGPSSTLNVNTYEPLDVPVLTATYCDAGITLSNGDDALWYLNGTLAPHLSGTHITLAESGTYHVTVANFCGVKESNHVQAYPLVAVVTPIPNVITPNGDGVNDVLELDRAIADAAVRITNRWGETIYTSVKYQNDWSAQNVSSGTYYITVSHPCLPHAYRGWLTIMK